MNVLDTKNHRFEIKFECLDSQTTIARHYICKITSYAIYDKYFQWL